MSGDVDNLDGLFQWRRSGLFLLGSFGLVDKLVRVVGSVLVRLEALELLVVLEVAEFVIALRLHLYFSLVLVRFHSVEIVILVLVCLDALVSLVFKVKLCEIVILDVCILVRLSVRQGENLNIEDNAGAGAGVSPGCLKGQNHLVDGQGQHEHGEQGGGAQEAPPAAPVATDHPDSRGSENKNEDHPDAISHSAY